MTDYLLFIDTEASGLPKDWEKPYSAKDNWPFCVQVSWVIYTAAGKEIKQENHFIQETNLKISKSALKVHGITEAYLQTNGEGRKEVMEMLAADVRKFKPLIVGHFIEFDCAMLGADFYRTGVENPIKREMTFCTMLATRHLVQNPSLKFFRLGELYQTLFHTTLNNQHNALVDAKATAECFFELKMRGEVSDETIALQQNEVRAKSDAHALNAQEKQRGCVIPLIFIIFLTYLILHLL